MPSQTLRDRAAEFAGQHLLITGATGFIGRVLTETLLAAGAHITALHRLGSTPPAGCISLVLERWTGADVTSLFAQNDGLHFDGMFNLAAYGVMPQERDPALMTAVNVDSALALARQAMDRGTGFFVQAGSSAEYADPTDDAPLSEASPLEMTKLYGASKVAAGFLLVSEAVHRQFPLAHARLFGVYGAGEKPHRLLPSLVRSLRDGQRVALSPGLQQRDFLHVEDVVSALLALAKSIRTSGTQTVVNVSSGKAVSVADFARKVADRLQISQDLLGFGDLPMRPDEVMYLIGTHQRLADLTGWAPTWSLTQGIERSIDALLEHEV